MTYVVHDPAHVDRWGRDVPAQARTIAARCLCEKGQLRTSRAIPLIADVVQFTSELQDLYPEGVPDVIPLEAVVEAPIVGRVRRGRRRQLHLDYKRRQRKGVESGKTTDDDRSRDRRD